MRLQAPAQRCLRYGACAFLQDTASSTSWSPPPSTPSTRPFPTATTCTPSSTTSPSTCIKNRKESLSLSLQRRDRDSYLVYFTIKTPMEDVREERLTDLDVVADLDEISPLRRLSFAHFLSYIVIVAIPDLLVAWLREGADARVQQVRDDVVV